VDRRRDGGGIGRLERRRISGKMKCVTSAAPGPMKMNHATNAAIGIRMSKPIAVT
jgi:hypothetical protein